MAIPTRSHYIGREAKATAWLIHLVMWRTTVSIREAIRIAMACSTDPGSPTVNFHVQRRSNLTHQSITDPRARLAKEGAGKESKLCYSAHALMENRNTILVDFQVEPPDGYAERRAAIVMVEGALAPPPHYVRRQQDYDTRDFVGACPARLRSLRSRPATWRAQGTLRSTLARCAIRATRSVSGFASASRRAFGWMEMIGGLRRTRYRGRERVQMHADPVATE